MTGLGRVTTVVAVAVVFVLGASAADLKGSLIDVACSAKIIKDGEAAAKAHTRECMLNSRVVPRESPSAFVTGLTTKDPLKD